MADEGIEVESIDARVLVFEPPEEPMVFYKLNSHSVVWRPDCSSDTCFSCRKPFTLFRRRHHCRKCGLLYCGTCCPKRACHDGARVCIADWNEFKNGYWRFGREMTVFPVRTIP